MADQPDSEAGSRNGSASAERPSGAEMIPVGRIGRPHGVRGDLTLVPDHTGASLLGECLESGDGEPPRLFLEEGRQLPVTGMKAGSSGRFILSVEGVETREAASALTGSLLSLWRDETAEPASGWYPRDLLGLEVVDKEGRVLGRVEGILATGGVDVLEIEGDLGSWMLPAVEPLVAEVDREGGRVIVDPPEGLVPGTEEA